MVGFGVDFTCALAPSVPLPLFPSGGGEEGSSDAAAALALAAGLAAPAPPLPALQRALLLRARASRLRAVPLLHAHLGDAAAAAAAAAAVREPPPLTLANLHVYLAGQAEALLGKCVAPAVGAVLSGLAAFSPAPRALLRLLSAAEWAEALGEDAEALWARGALREGLAPDSSLSSSSSILDWLADTLASFSPSERRAFMEFTLGTSKQPVGGLKGKPLGVAISKDKADAALPTANTCVFKLTLPRYTSQAMLAARLRVAIMEGRGFFDRD